MRAPAVVLAALLFSSVVLAQAAPSQPPTITTRELMAHVTHLEKAANPPIAMAAHVNGDVVIGVELDSEGNVTQFVVISGPEMLRASAIAAAKKWTFSPVLIDGKPQTVRGALVYRFVDGRSVADTVPAH